MKLFEELKAKGVLTNLDLKSFSTQNVPVSSCTMKETIDIDIATPYTNDI